MSKVHAYAGLISSDDFTTIRDALAPFISEVRRGGTTLEPTMVALEFILQAQDVYQDHVYERLQKLDFAPAMKAARLFYDRGVVNHPNGNGQNDLARIEFDAVRRWGVSNWHSGDEVFWLGIASALYSAPFEKSFTDLYQHVRAGLGERYTWRFEAGKEQHECVGRQFNFLVSHIRLFMA